MTVSAGKNSKGCRILILIGEMGSGGAEQQMCYYLQAMDRERYQPHLVVWNYQESDVNVARVRAMGVPIRGYPIEQSSLQKLYRFASLVRTLKPEIVHCFSDYLNFAAFFGARAGGAIAVGAIRGEINLTELMESRPVFWRLSSSLPRHQISNSHSAKKAMVQRAKWFAPKQTLVVPNALDLDRYRVAPVPKSPPFPILGIGSLVSCKRWDRVLKVAAELKRRDIPCVVQIAGDGPLREELEALRSAMGVTERVQFLGYRKDIPDLIASAGCIVHTSDSEGLPNALMEAMASGRAVVATDVGDVSRLIENGKTGFVVPANDSEALLSRIIEMIADVNIAERLGLAARDYARRNFALSRLVEETFDAYCSAGWTASI